MPDRTNLTARPVVVALLLFLPAAGVWSGPDRFSETAASKAAGGSSAGDVYLSDGNYIVVDDMESYNDSNNYIWDTWWDGCWHEVNRPGNITGAWIELAIDPCEPVHTGTQAMEYYYDNSLSPERCGNYSQVWRYYDPPVDWASHGEKALVLWFRGAAGNETTPMWVVVYSYSGYSEMSTYGDNGEDPEDITVEEWMEWNIRLGDFADGGVDLANVSSVGIGFGDYVDNVPDYTTGVVYFDDIRLYPARCVARYAPEADLSGDCLVHWQDLSIMAGQWLQTGGGAQGIAADGDIANSLTTAGYSASDYNECQAWGPWPADGQTEVQSAMAEVVLCWQPGCCISGRGRHSVYFGSDYDCVANAAPEDPNCWVGYQRAEELCVNVGKLALWQTFYWRIDELDIEYCKGNVWSFTTGCEIMDGDINLDCLINLEDYAVLVGDWLEQIPLWPPE